MRTVAIFSNGKNQAVRLPRNMEYQKVSELARHFCRMCAGYKQYT